MTKTRPRNKFRATAIAGAVAVSLMMGAVTAAIANQDSGIQQGGAQTATQECQMMNSAVSNAVKNQMSIVDMFMNSAEKNMSRVMNNSCLSALQMLNFNLAALIPDFSIFGALLDAAINKVVTYLTDQVCQAINSTIGDWNQIVNDLKVDFNVNSQLESWADGVLMEVPGGNSPSLTTPKDGVVGSGGSFDLFDGKNPGVIDTSGYQPSNTGGSAGTGGSNPTDQAIGSNIGAQYAQALQQCETTKSRWQSLYSSSSASNSTVESARIPAMTACSSARSLYAANKQYLSSMGEPSLPSTLSQNTNSTRKDPTVSDSSGGFSLPVRN